MDRYKYSVTPFSPIKELIPGKSIRAPFSADLSMDEVFMCMKHGPVYRLFPGKDPIRVTGSNLPSLHRAKFEEEPVVDKVEVPVVEEVSTKEEVYTFSNTEEKTEEPVVMETAFEEEVVEEPTPIVEETAEEVDEELEEETEDINEEEEVQVEEQSVESTHKYNPQFKPNYNKKNRKHNNKNH
jgi:hypothetical protein